MLVSLNEIETLTHKLLVMALPNLLLNAVFKPRSVQQEKTASHNFLFVILIRVHRLVSLRSKSHVKA